jgi:hypothetical protein
MYAHWGKHSQQDPTGFGISSLHASHYRCSRQWDMAHTSSSPASCFVPSFSSSSCFPRQRAFLSRLWIDSSTNLPGHQERHTGLSCWSLRPMKRLSDKISKEAAIQSPRKRPSISKMSKGLFSTSGSWKPHVIITGSTTVSISYLSTLRLSLSSVLARCLWRVQGNERISIPVEVTAAIASHWRLFFCFCFLESLAACLLKIYTQWATAAFASGVQPFGNWGEEGKKVYM